MAQTNVDPNRVIQALGAQVAQLTLQNTMLTIALEDAQAAHAALAKQLGVEPGPDGT